MAVPGVPYVGLFGSQKGDRTWCRRHGEVLARRGVPFFDPTDVAGWDRVRGMEGTARAAAVDALVARERRAILGAAAVVFHFEVVAGGSLASRFELGLLSALPAVPVFLHVPPGVAGEDYLAAQGRLVAHFHRCATLEEATASAGDWYLARYDGNQLRRS